MFFKQAIFYRITERLEVGAEELAAALAAKAFREPAETEAATYGFVEPLPRVDGLVQSAGPAMLIAARHAKRDLPKAVVDKALAEKIEQIQQEEKRKVYKAEKDRLRDDVTVALLPRAFVKYKTIHAYIVDNLIVIQSGTYSAAEDFLSALREALGSLQVRPVSSKVQPSSVMTSWLVQQTAGNGFFVLSDCELVDTGEDAGVVRCKNQDLGDMSERLLGGEEGDARIVTKLALAWEDKLTFTLAHDLTLKGIKFGDLLEEQAGADGGDDDAGIAIASIAIAAGTFGELLPRLLLAFGGEQLPEGE